MSLINQMLRDLDQQRGPASGAEVAALHGLGLVDKQVRRPHIVSLVGIALAIALAVALGYWTVDWLAGEPTPAILTALQEGPSADPAPTSLQSGEGPIEVSSRHRQRIHKQAKTEPGEVAGIGKEQPALHHDEPQTVAVKKAATTAQPSAESTIQGAIASIEAKPLVKSTQVINKDATPNTTSRHSLGPGEKAKRLYNQAQQALVRNRSEAAGRLLEQALAEDPRHAAAREQLVMLMIKAQQTSRAESLLAEGLALGPMRIELVQAYAQLLVERGAFQQALTALQGVSDNRTADAETLALRAGILSRLQRHAEAADTYRQALQKQPDQAVWWTGLGVALEQGGLTIPALDAYRHAGRLPLQSEIRQFVQQRIQALGGPGAGPQG